MSKAFFEKRYKQWGGKVVPPIRTQTLRRNTTRLTEQEFINRLSNAGITVEKRTDIKNAFDVIKARVSPGATTEYLQGYYYLQEAAAQIPVQILNPKPGERVLDCCAAPGGKTTQICEYMQNKGTLIAFELKEHRIPSLLVNLERMGCKNVTVYNEDICNVTVENKDPKQAEQEQFDKILVDAPCSGNHANDSKWFEKRDYQGVIASRDMQRRILKAAAQLLKPKGILVYSTCSLEVEENEFNIAWLLEQEKGLKLLPVTVHEEQALLLGDPGLTEIDGKTLPKEIALCRRFWPHKTGTQGFFVAKVQKC